MAFHSSPPLQHRIMRKLDTAMWAILAVHVGTHPYAKSQGAMQSFILPLPRIPTSSSHSQMWSNLLFDLLAKIFSYLPPVSLARASAACRTWHAAADQAPTLSAGPPWFLALPARTWSISCYAHNPIQQTWHLLNLDRTRTTTPMRPIATIGGLILLKLATTTSLRLAICNPFTNQYRLLPLLIVARTNPAVGVVMEENNRNRRSGFKIYVAGGMSEAASGGASYEPTVEVYESPGDKWKMMGAMPVEFAVRLTVWSPNESVYSNGVLYWMTSARAYSVMGFDIPSNAWRELSVPMADSLEFAALVGRNGKVAVVGGKCGVGGWVWELGSDDLWGVVGKVPFELGVRLLGEKLNWACVKCVGIDGAICLYRDLGSGIIVWREVSGEGKWEWGWIDGCSSVRSFPIKGLLLQPSLARSGF